MRLRTAILALACAAACMADSLTLRNGQVVQGIYMGGTARTVKMQVDDTVKTYDVTDVATLQFTPPAPAYGRRPRTRRSIYEAGAGIIAFGHGPRRAKAHRGRAGG